MLQKLMIVPLVLLLHVSLFGVAAPKLTNTLSYQEIQNIAASDVAAPQENSFAYHIAMEGTTALIASQGNGSDALGAVYIYEYNAATMQYDYQAKLTPSDTNASKRYFASAVAILGDTIVVGAPKKDLSALSYAYVYEKQGVAWSDMTEQAKLSINGASGSFARSLTISNNYIFVGDQEGGYSSTGTVYCYLKPGDSWADDGDPARVIEPSNGMSGDFFGSSLAFENDILVIGASRTDSNNGAVYVYKYEFYNFIQLAKLTKTGGSLRLGTRVAIKGTTIAASATFRYGGEVYLYEQSGGLWVDASTPTAVLRGSDIRSALDGTPPPAFGNSITFCNDTLSIGSYNKTVYLYDKPYYGWVDMNQTTQIHDTNSSGSVSFGSLAVCNDTAMLIKTDNAAYVFKEGLALSHVENSKDVVDLQTADEATQTYTLLNSSDKALFNLNSSTGALSFKAAPDFESPHDAEADNHYKLRLHVSNGTQSTQYPISIRVSDLSYEAGAIKTESFTQQQLLNASVSTGQTLYFGTSMAMDGDTLVIGDTIYNNGSEQVGAAFVFERNATTQLFEQRAILSTYSAQTSEYLGSSVAISGDIIVVAAADERNGEAGDVYVYVKPENGWSDMMPTHHLLRHDNRANEEYGKGIAISGNTIIVSAPNSLVDATDYVYLYDPKAGWEVYADHYETALLYASIDRKNSAGGSDFGESLAIDGNTVAIGAPYFAGGQGAVFIYEKPESGWVSMSETALQGAPVSSDYRAFGWSVALEGDSLAVGAPQVFGADVDAALFVFKKPLYGWGATMQNGTIYKNSSPQNWDGFGKSVAFSNGTALTTAGGDLYLFDATQSAEVHKILHTDSNAFQGFAIKGDILMGGYDNSVSLYKAEIKKSTTSPALIMYLLN